MDVRRSWLGLFCAMEKHRLHKARQRHRKEVACLFLALSA